MSIKTSNEKILFLFLSLSLHAGMVGISILAGGMGAFLRPAHHKEPSVFVDIIELLPGARGIPAEPGKTTRFAQRPNRVERESIPEKRIRPRLRVAIKEPIGQGKNERPAASSASPSRTAAQGPLPESLKGEAISGVDAKSGADADTVSATAVRPGSNSGGAYSLSRKAGRDAQDKEGLSLFPTEERIAELAQIYEKDSPKGEKGKILALNTSELKYHRYLLSMKRKIEAYWDYPSSSVRNGEQGILTIDFTIIKSGGIEHMEVVKSSNYPTLDDAAATAIKLASPFSPFPLEFDIERVNIHATFEYQILYAGRR